MVTCLLWDQDRTKEVEARTRWKTDGLLGELGSVTGSSWIMVWMSLNEEHEKDFDLG